MRLKSTKALGYAALVVGVNLATSVSADNYQNQNNDNSRNNSYSYNNGSKTTTVVSDQDIANKIRDKIGPGWFSSGYEQVNAQVHNGNVVLEGSVKTIEDKEKVEKEVRNIDGVRSLNSQISVQEPNRKADKERNEFPKDVSGTAADEQLNRKIRNKVSRGWLWDSYEEVTLNTNNGVVTLEGTVDKVSDQQKLIDEVQKIDGVRAVRSNLNIKNE